eukprot:CAMPEP_0185805572 /NCGR_PEP_ID=MMETSP1322-20130828/3937_1 /TAXON_ID=265543 /ORGANISM="Minutocellus polymorphus, Strain RCC2270" /LENGTH=331 /DNA_ID=CAMNT_0028501617 /DNA_START=152 /DNA_END=1143 /DNA_ORIENTATION=-
MKVGSFTLEIINAESREPMKEFEAPDGKVYIEAEPDLEYFLRCSSDRPGRPRTYASLDIDGTGLGYKNRFTTKTADLGLWKSVDGVSSYVALKFVLKRTRAVPAAGDPAATTPPVGCITAKFYECTKGKGMVEAKDQDHTGKIPAGIDNQADNFSAMGETTGKKAFASVAGSTISGGGATAIGAVAGAGGAHSGGYGGGGAVAKKEKKPRMKPKYDTGPRLGQISIHYTSALGFIHLGILPTVPAVAADGAEDEGDRKKGGTSGGGDGEQQAAARDDIVAAAAAAAQAADAAGAAAALGGDHPVEPDRKRVKTEGAAAAANNNATGGGGGG